VLAPGLLALNLFGDSHEALNVLPFVYSTLLALPTRREGRGIEGIAEDYATKSVGVREDPIAIRTIFFKPCMCFVAHSHSVWYTTWRRVPRDSA